MPRIAAVVKLNPCFDGDETNDEWQVWSINTPLGVASARGRAWQGVAGHGRPWQGVAGRGRARGRRGLSEESR